MPQFKLATGNLPAAIAATAVEYNKKDDAAIKVLDIAATNRSKRVCFIGYKVSKEDAKIADKILPQNFAVVIPALTLDQFSDETTQPNCVTFVEGLIADFQDDRLHAVADKKADFDPTDVAALIADYFDTSRSGIKLADIKAWLADEFLTAFLIRRTEINDRVAPGNMNKLNETQLQAICESYEKHVLAICSKTGIRSLPVVQSVRDSLLKLRELDLLTGGEVYDHVLARCQTMIAAASAVIVDEV